MENIKKEIEHLVNKETQSWDEKNVESLLELFHEDMVWPWPKNERSHDPMEWEIVLGKYSYKRWKKVWEELFNKNDLIKNERVIKKIEISFEKDAAFAVVDINTVWKNKETGNEISWKGRVCKVYSKCKNGWKITMHTGVLDYNNIL